MKLVTISHIKVCGANGASSAITAGIPSIPSILGTVLNLERHMQNVHFPGTAIILHSCSYNGRTTYYKGAKVIRPVIARNPLNESGNTEALEDAITVNLDISLVLKVEGADLDRKEVREKEFPDKVRDTLMMLSLASGSIQGVEKIWVTDTTSEKKNKILKKLCPGYVLVSRKDEFARYMKEHNKNAMQALVEYCGIHYEENKYKRLLKGWKIPISVGYMPLTQPETREDTINPHPHVFVESLVSLGECVFVTKEKDIEKLFWHYGQNRNLYECVFN